MSLEACSPLREPSPEIIGLLSDLLEKAKRGELHSVAFAFVGMDREIGSGWSTPFGEPFPLVGAVHVLDTEVMRTRIELPERDVR